MRTAPIARTQAIRLLAARRLAELSPRERMDLLVDMWPIEPGDSEFGQLPNELQNELTSTNEPRGDAMDNRYSPLLLCGLEREWKGVRNEYLTAQLAKLEIEAEVTGEVEPLFSCPCCGYRTLERRGEYDVCTVCMWEDTGIDDLDLFSGPNHMTLRQARENFHAYGAVAEELKSQIAADAADRFYRHE